MQTGDKFKSKDVNVGVRQLYVEIEKHLLRDKEPSVYLGSLLSNPNFKQYPFVMLYNLKETLQSPIYHPEGNVWNHVMLVVDQAAKLRNKAEEQEAFMWAALLHDIGKPSTTKMRKGRITSYDHDKVGKHLTKEFLSVFTDYGEFIDKVANLVRYHMQMLYVLNNLPYANIKNMKMETDIEEVALLGFCDRMGRKNSDKKMEEENMSRFLNKCKYFHS